MADELAVVELTTTALQREGNQQLARIEAMQVVDGDSYVQVVEAAKVCRARQRAVHEFMDPICAAADRAHKAATTGRAELLRPFERGAAAADGKALAWDTAQERLRQEAEAHARKELERLVAEARAEQEAEVARLLKAAEDERIEAAVEAESRGDVETATRLMEEPFDVPLPPPVAIPIFTPPVQVAATPKVEGYGFKKAPWVAVLENLDAVIAAAHAGNRVAKSLLAFDQRAADKLADSQRDIGSSVPGVRFEEGRRRAWGRV